MHSDLPKVLQPLAGRPLIAHVLEAARDLDPATIHIVYGHRGETVRAALPAADLRWVHQAEQRGTGHAVQQALPAIPDDHIVLILYGDVPLVRAATLSRLVEIARGGRLALLTARLEDPTGYGRIRRDQGGRVTGIVEERDASPEQRRITEIHTGLLAAPAQRLRAWLAEVRADNAQGELYLTDVVGLAVAHDTAVEAVYAADAAEAQGVNDKCQLAAVETEYRSARARELLLAGATLADPARLDVRGVVVVGRDVFIDVNVVFLGSVVLGDRVRIGPNCVVRDATIGTDTQIHANCVIEEAELGEDCRIGPYARLRPGTKLHPRVHVGNFVEVKNSELGEASKANHLSYLGDARIGAQVNVGAGTITCNYDGANKWPTEIGDGAFIGSGSMLVAPVAIGSGATIGAGSTISASTPADRLTLTRATQTTVDGWKRPGKYPADAKSAKIADAFAKSPAAKPKT